MSISAARANSFRVPKQQATQSMVMPAPIGGMDGRIGAAMDDPKVCIWAINMIPAEYGLRVRSGYREWQVGLGSEVRTIIPYYGSDSGVQTPDRIFACTTDGIYDVTNVGAAPVNKLMFSLVDEDSGFGVFIHYVDESGKDLIFYADGSNGLFTYDPVADSWAQSTGITAAAGSINTFNVDRVNYVVQHKLRIWLIEKNTNHAWYLPVRASQGAAEEFFFASKFRHGGNLVGLYNWTVDGGNGRDDHLVAIGRGGDVIPWTGEDPSDVMTWTSTGTFFIGTIPRGNRIATEYGGELYMLSSLGVITMSDLLRGGNPDDPFRDNIGYRISLLLRNNMELYQSDHGWSMSFLTHDGQLMLNMPQLENTTYQQFIYNLSTSGWGLWRDVPMLCSETWDGKLMIGTKDGRVLRMDVDADNIDINATSKTAINWYVLTSYFSMGSPGQFKRVKFIRPNFLADTLPNFSTEAFYDYQVVLPAPVDAPTDVDPSSWDVGIWDEATWTTADAVPYSRARGACGMGRTIAAAISGSSFNDTFLASFEVMWDTGGYL